MNDSDFSEEAVTSELRAYRDEPAARPAFFAMGTQSGITDLEPPLFVAMGTESGIDLDEQTQPIPRMTMHELVFGDGTQPPPLSSKTLSEYLSVDQVEMPASVPATSRKIRPRRSRPRARTIAPRRLTSVELREVTQSATAQAARPQTRAECAQEQRPCPWVSCKHHLYLDVNPRTGSIKLNFPDLEPWELQHTCSLDVADDGGHTLEEVGDITNLTRERIRQLEFRGLVELRGRSRSLR